MKTENSILRQQALNSLTGKWGIAIGGCFLYLIATAVCQNIPILGSVASLILTGPFQLGLTKFILSIVLISFNSSFAIVVLQFSNSPKSTEPLSSINFLICLFIFLMS